MNQATTPATILLAGPLLFAGALTGDAHAQSTWSLTYGGPVSEQGLKDLRELPGGRLVAAGYTASFGGPTQASWLLNLDVTTGDVGLEQVSTSAFGGYTDSARVAADGGALFLGRDVLDIFLKHDAWIMRANPQGQIDWSLGFTRPSIGRHFLFDAEELPDGSWIAVGATGFTDQPPQAAWVVRVSATGNLMWQYEYGGGVTETASCVTTTSDGGFAVAGWTNSSGAGSDDVWVMKLDALGAIQWQTTYGGADEEQAEGIVELADGGFALAGYSRGFTASGFAPWILRLDKAGGLVWQEAIDGGTWGNVEGISTTQDGELVVVGRVAEPGFPTNDLWSAKLAAADGKILWQRAYEGAQGDYGSVVIPLGCEGFAMGGTWGWGFPGEAIWLQRTDGDGGLSGCGIERKTSFPVTSPKVTVQKGITVRAPGGAIPMAPGLKTGKSSAVVNTLCKPAVAVLEVSREGVPPNPKALLPGTTSGPIIGETWDPVIDHTSFFPGAVVDFLAVVNAPANIPLPGLGTLLCDPGGVLVAQFVASAPGQPFAAPIPQSCGFVGLQLYTQGVSSDGVAMLLTNALDITIGTH